MFYYKEELINIIKPDKSDPAAAKQQRCNMIRFHHKINRKTQK